MTVQVFAMLKDHFANEFEVSSKIRTTDQLKSYLVVFLLLAVYLLMVLSLLLVEIESQVLVFHAHIFEKTHH